MTEKELISFLKDKKGFAKNLLNNYSLEGISCNLLRRNKNQSVFSDSDKPGSFLFVVSGEVMISRGGKVEVINEKEFFGIDTLEDERRNYNAIAVRPSIILEILINNLGIEKKPLPVKDNIIHQAANKIPQPIPVEGEIKLNRNQDEDFSITTYADIVIVFINLVKATLSESKRLLGLLDKLIQEDNQRKIIIDLRMCTLVDSTFLGVLVKSHKSIKEKNGEIVLIYNTNDPSTLFMVTYMDKVFKTFNNMEDAIKHFKS